MVHKIGGGDTNGTRHGSVEQLPRILEYALFFYLWFQFLPYSSIC